MSLQGHTSFTDLLTLSLNKAINQTAVCISLIRYVLLSLSLICVIYCTIIKIMFSSNKIYGK
jgi:hypothetical protein